MEFTKEKRKQTLIFAAILYVLALFIGLHVVQQFVNNPNGDILSAFIDALSNATSNPFGLSGVFKHSGDVIKMVLIVTGIGALIYVYAITDMQSKAHVDSATAKGTSKFNDDYKGYKKKYTVPLDKTDPEAVDKNIILAKDLSYGLVRGRNTNVMIIGGSGSGKTFGIIKPNIMQMNSSMVITDPSGDVFRVEAKLLLEHGYEVKLFSTNHMENSNCYNPFDYVYDEEGNLDETRVSTMIHMFLKNAGNMEEAKAASGDKFWDQAANALLSACAMYLLEFKGPECHNMYEILRLVRKGKASEQNENMTALDIEFNNARKLNPDAHCFSSYDIFHLAPARTANSILISAGVDLNKFAEDKVRNMTTTAYKVKSRNLNGQIREFERDEDGNLIRTDENIDLRTIGDKKTAVFINIPQANPTYNFLVSMMYSQLFEALYGKAESIYPKKWLVVNKRGEAVMSMINSEDDGIKLIKYYADAQVVEHVENGKSVFYIENPKAEKRFWLPGTYNGALKKVYNRDVGEKYIQEMTNGKVKKGAEILPWHVQCLLDEFANIGQIPNFPQMLATMRRYEISCMIVLQSLAQIKNRYDKLFSDILSNCDNLVFLGSSDPETCEYISKRLGKKTQKIQNISRSGGKKGGVNKSINVDSRELMMPDEVARLEKTHALIFTNGEQPFNALKYKASDHKHWDFTNDDKNRIEPTEYVYSKEKMLSRAGDAFAQSEEIALALSKKTATGKPLSTVKEVKSVKEVAEAASLNSKSKNVGEQLNSAKRQPDMSGIQSWDVDDDEMMDMPFASSNKKSSASVVSKRVQSSVPTGKK